MTLVRAKASALDPSIVTGGGCAQATSKPKASIAPTFT